MIAVNRRVLLASAPSGVNLIPYFVEQPRPLYWGKQSCVIGGVLRHENDMSAEHLPALKGGWSTTAILKCGTLPRLCPRCRYEVPSVATSRESAAL